jgi:hypothetical protein
VDHRADVAGKHGTAICASGAFVYDVSRRTVIQARGMPPSTVRATSTFLVFVPLAVRADKRAA